MTTYYVDGVDGDDLNAGTSEGAGNAWKTIGKAAATVAGGDIVFIKGNVNYDEQVTIVTAGAVTGPINWIGYTTTPLDGGKATINGGSTRTYCISGSLESHNIWRNIVFRDATGTLYNDAGADEVGFYNCDFINGSIAASVDNECWFVRCTFDGQSSNPINCDLYAVIIECYVTNGSARCQIDGSTIIGSVFNKTGGTADTILINTNANGQHVYYCNTFYDDTATPDKKGIWDASGAGRICMNNILQGHDWAIDFNAASYTAARGVIENNVFFSNTNKYGSDTDPSAVMDTGDIDGDPSLNTTTFEIDSDSNAYGAGTQFRTS